MFKDKKGPEKRAKEREKRDRETQLRIVEEGREAARRGRGAGNNPYKSSKYRAAWEWGRSGGD